ncbi:MAG: DUF4145 domain-containing protein [Lachnospiraceae bacterium]|nr:DUF4145 domain-containing protein [Lachnospiraceae bacterium]
MKEVFSDVQALDFNRNRFNIFDMYDNERVPFELVFDDICPVCGYGIDMGRDYTHKFHDISSDNQQECKVACIHLCGHCHKLFVTEHVMRRSKESYIEKGHTVYPIIVQHKEISDEIKKVSSDFENLYIQACSASAYGLKDIYGMALRKAFECLVKDYALFLNPKKEDEIVKKSLANCIRDYIENTKIVELCTSCRIIGNNETHWKNNNTADDIIFMEKVLGAVLHFIEQEMIVLDAKKFNDK